MSVNIHGIDVEDQVYREVKARGNSIAPCQGCGLVLLEIRDTHGENFCINCINKKSRLSRYSNSHYRPTQAERQQVLRGSYRAGR